MHMPAPKRNKNAVGNRGGGRKSAYEELREAKWLQSVWNGDVNILELEQKLQNGSYSVRDRLLYDALRGDPGALRMLANKALPDWKDAKDDPAVNPQVFPQVVIMNPSSEPFTITR